MFFDLTNAKKREKVRKNWKYFFAFFALSILLISLFDSDILALILIFCLAMIPTSDIEGWFQRGTRWLRAKRQKNDLTNAGDSE